jgi:hypothetical protein
MQQRSLGLDGVGLGLSGLCLGHCLLLPLAAAGLPLLGAWAESPWVHVVLVLIAAPVAGLSLLLPKRGQPRAPAVVGVGVVGLALLVFGAFGPEAAEHAATIAGSLMLALAHGLNWRLGRDRCSAN